MNCEQPLVTPVVPELLHSLNGFPVPPQSVSAEQMLDRLARFFRQYLHCSADQLAVLSLWTLHTHCFSAARSTPYLNICSHEKQSGKSLCLELLGLVCANAWYATGVTSSALTRKVASTRPTVLLDECQTVFGASDKRIRGLLLNGCKRGGVYELSHGRDSSASVVDVFCPKAFAGMAVISPAIDDRSIPIVLQAVGAAKSSACPEAPIRRFIVEQAREEAAPLVAWLRHWSAQKLPEIAEALPYTRNLMPAQLSLRQQDCIEPLLHLADLVGGQVPEQTRGALVRTLCRDSTQSCFVQLLSDIRNAFANVNLGNRAPTSALLHFLNAMESRPWRTWHYGDPMTPINLARILRPLGIVPENIRIDRDCVLKGYCFRDFVPLWRRHLGFESPVKPQPRPSATDATDATRDRQC